MKARQRGFGMIAAALTAVAVVVLVAGTGAVSAAKPQDSNTLLVTHTNYPGPSVPGVTYGKDVGSTLTVKNPGKNPWNKVIVTAPAPTTTVTLPSGEKVTKSATLAYTNVLLTGGCPTTPSGQVGTSTTVRCDLGTVDPNLTESFTFIFVWTVPSAGSSTGCTSAEAPCLVNTITVTGSEGTSGPDGPPSSHEDTFVKTVKTTLLDSPDTDKEKAGTYALTACTSSANPTLTTNPAVDRNHGISTAVCVPNLNGAADDPGVTVSVTETAKNTGPGKTEVSRICIPAPGYTCSTDVYTPFTFGSFATFVFTVSNKSFNGQLTQVLYDGTEDGVDNFLPVSTDPTVSPHWSGTFVVDNQAQTTTFVIASKKNGRYTGS